MLFKEREYHRQIYFHHWQNLTKWKIELELGLVEIRAFLWTTQLDIQIFVENSLSKKDNASSLTK